jgi:predicted PurR-regulated permease PerM
MQQTQATGLPPPAWLEHMPIVGDRLTDWWRTHVGSSNAVKEFLGTINAGWALGWARAIAGEVARESGLFLITLLALLSFLARGDIIATQAQLVAKRIFGRFGEDFLARLTEAARRTVAGTLLVSVVEGSIIGIGYVVAGVPQPLLFTVVTILLALVPFGAWAVFGLAGLILIGQDHVVAGVSVMAYSATIMTLGDNLVQPAVIGGAMRLPFLLALVGTFGGIAAMGLVGLFIGPVIMVALLLIWRQWATNMAGDEPPK